MYINVSCRNTCNFSHDFSYLLLFELEDMKKRAERERERTFSIITLDVGDRGASTCLRKVQLTNGGPHEICILFRSAGSGESYSAC